MKDIFGQEVQPGDEFAYAVTAGRGAVLNYYRFVEVVDVESTVLGSRTPDSLEYKRIKAECIKAKKWGRGGQLASLHADLFADRAILVKKALQNTQ